MADHNELGKEGENIAAQYMLKEGFEILERNWRFGKEEIDLIAKKDDELVIVEVKTRNSDFFGKPHEAVSKSKQAHMIKAANAYIEKHDLDVETRFDVIGIILNKKQRTLEHIEGAFMPRW